MLLEVSLTFLGHSAWRIAYNHFDILIDPFITGNPLAEKAGVNVDALNPTHIIVSHGHGDHIGDTVSLAKRSGAEVITTYELANYLSSQGCEKTVGMGVGGARTCDFGRIKFTLAHHGSSNNDGEYMGIAAGILLSIDGRTIYHAGDTALFSDMKLIGERHPIDLALLPIGDFYTMGIDDAVTAVEYLKPRLTVPMHYNTFPPIMVDAEEFRAKLEAHGHKGLILHPGESYQLPAGV